jgi:signal transduction histidine kinase
VIGALWNEQDSLFGRLALIFVSGLAITLGILFWVHLPEREAFVFRVSAGRAAHRLTDFVKMADQLPLDSREKLSQVARSQAVRMSFTGGALSVSAPGPGSRADVFRHLLLEDLGREALVAVAVTPVNNIAPEPGEAQLREGFEFTVQARLSDGSWVALETEEPRWLSRWPQRMLRNLVIIMGVLAVLSVIAVRWVTRPLFRLAEAAQALGRDINRPALSETGPREVQRATRAFNSMQERLQRYIRNRTGMLTAMSHDLKTPITRLRLRAELLDQPEVRDKFVRDLGEMEKMVNSTLEFMRGLDDREPLRAIDVGALADALKADAEELGQPLRVLGKPTGKFVGKPEGLKRCLQNLLDNAQRYGRDAELVIEDSDASLILRVRDSGPGIPAQELERVFEPFYRLEGSRNRGTGGTGLGLSIARNIAQAMGGDVVLRNREGGGLEAKLVLPRAERVALEVSMADGNGLAPGHSSGLSGLGP